MKTYNVEIIDGALEINRVDNCEMIDLEKKEITRIIQDAFNNDLVFISLDITEKLNSLIKKLNSDKLKIWSWEQLSKVKPSKTHKLNIIPCDCYGWIIKNVKINERDEYLSTHTFYGGDTTKYYNNKLAECGFDVELQSWDD